jgi:hypothetical protein
MLVLYNSQPTGNSYKVRLLLSILQIPYAAIEVDIFNGGNKTAAYRRINPRCKGQFRLSDMGRNTHEMGTFFNLTRAELYCISSKTLQ